MSMIIINDKIINIVIIVVLWIWHILHFVLLVLYIFIFENQKWNNRKCVYKITKFVFIYIYNILVHVKQLNRNQSHPK